MDQKVSLQILVHLFGKDFPIGKPMSSTFRRDSDPSLVIYYDDKSGFNFFDFGHGETKSGKYDIIELLTLTLQYLHPDKGYNRITSRIFAQENLSSLKIPKVTEVKKRIIAVENPTIIVKSHYDEWELSYWADREQSQSTLIRESIYGLREFYYNDRYKTISEEGCPRFIYDLEKDGWKMYSPMDKQMKWKSGGNLVGCIEGWDTLPFLSDTLYIGASTKDRLGLKLLFTDVINPTAEGSFRAIMERKDVIDSNYKNVFILYDDDAAGIKHSQNLASKTGWNALVGLNYPVLPDSRRVHCNDIDDIIFHYNSNELSKFTKQFLK